MERKDTDVELLLLLGVALAFIDDPSLRREIVDQLRSELRRGNLWNPSLDELIYRLDDPRHVDRALDQLRYRLRRGKGWSHRLDELFEYASYRGRRFGSLPQREMREIALSVLDGFQASIQGTLSTRLEESSRSVEEISNRQDSLESELQEQSRKALATAGEFHRFLWCNTVGIDFESAELIRYVPARIYIGDDKFPEEQLDLLVGRLVKFFTLSGLEQAEEFPAESGSWWKKFILKSKEALTHGEVTDRLEKAESALQAQYLDRPQAEANRNQAEAAASVIGSLKEVPHACVQVGSLLIVKNTAEDGRSAVIARTLTRNELKSLEENQSMLGKPSDILRWLESAEQLQISSGAADAG